MGAKTGNRKDLFPGALEMMILQVLRQQPLHGYGLVQHIQPVSNDLLRVEEGSLYPALQRLLKAGCVTARWGTSASGRRVRSYQLTPAGRKHLDGERSRWSQLVGAIARIMDPA